MSLPSSPTSVSTRTSMSTSLRQRSALLEMSPMSPKLHTRAVTISCAAPTVLRMRERDTAVLRLRLETVKDALKSEKLVCIRRLHEECKLAIESVRLAFEEAKWQLSDYCQSLDDQISAFETQLRLYITKEDYQLSAELASLADRREDWSGLSLLQVEAVGNRQRLIATVQESIKHCQPPVSEVLFPSVYSRPLVETRQHQAESTEVLLSLRHVWPESDVALVSKQLYDAGKEKIWLEDFAKAEELTKQALELMKARFPIAKRTVNCMLQLGRIYHIGLARLDEAQQLYSQAIEMCQSRYPEELEMVDACACMTGFCASVKDTAAGESWFAKGLHIANTHFSTSILLSKLYRAYACVKRQAKDIEGSFEYSLKALALSLSVSPNSWDTVLSYLSIAADYRDLGQFPEAENAFLRGAEFNPACGLSVRCLLCLSRMYRRLNRASEARSTLQRAVSTGVSQFPEAKSTKEAIMEASFAVKPLLKFP